MSVNDKHRRAHNLLLANRLFSSHGTVSPFTLIQDSLEQSGWPLLEHIISKSHIAGAKIIFVSFATVRRPPNVDEFIIPDRNTKTPLGKLLPSHINKSIHPDKRNLLLIDTIHPLLAPPNPPLSTILPTLLPNAQTTLLALYHGDIPHPSTHSPHPYAPPAATLLTHLPTTIVRVHCLAHTLARRAARDRALPEPLFGLDEAREGVLVGMPDARFAPAGRGGVVLEMEHRRRSGREIREWYVLTLSTAGGHGGEGGTRLGGGGPKRVGLGGEVVLMEEHELFRQPVEERDGEEEATVETTFKLGLSEKEKRDREAVVLPYFDAQKEGGIGEGGRILYDMGDEDDFDEEEDEI